MLDQLTIRGRLVAAALKLAAERPWREVTLANIAEAAGVSLVDVRREFNSKSDALASFVRMVDDAVLARAPHRTGTQPARDALFEVIMSRFDVLAAYKPALRSIAASWTLDPSVACAVGQSQAWMLRAAGIRAEGLEGQARAAGLAAVYASSIAPGSPTTIRDWRRRWRPRPASAPRRARAAVDRRCDGETVRCVQIVLRDFPQPVQAIVGRGSWRRRSGRHCSSRRAVRLVRPVRPVRLVRPGSPELSMRRRPIRNTARRTYDRAGNVDGDVDATGGTQVAAAQPTEIKEWQVPWGSESRPRDPFVGPDGRVWFVGQVGHYVVVLDTVSGQFKRYELDEGTDPHNLIVGPVRRGLVRRQPERYDWQLDPATGDTKRYPMPDPAARDPHTMIFDGTADIWFTVQRGIFVGQLDHRGRARSRS